MKLKEYIQQEVKRQLNEAYVPYKGGGSPSLEQTNDNTRHLAQELKANKIPFKINKQFMKDLTGQSGIISLEFKHPKTNKPFYIGYDRWGFTSDYLDALDQASLEKTVDFLKTLYTVKEISEQSTARSVGSVITPKGVSQLSTKNILKNIKTNAKYKPVSVGADNALIKHLISGKAIVITNKDLKNYEVVQ